MSLTERLRTFASLALAAGMFGTVGWMAMRPHDPLGAMSLVGHDRPVQVIVVGLALTVVAALLGEILSGACLTHFGVFTAGFGLSVVSLRGGSMRDLLLHLGIVGNRVETPVYVSLAGEVLLWSAVVLISFVACTSLMRWLRADDRPDAPTMRSGPRRRGSKPVDGLSALKKGSARSAGASGGLGIGQGLPALLCVSALAMLVIRVTAAGSPVDAIRTGQVFFSVGAGFFVGTWLVVQIFPRARFAWIVPAVPVVAVAGYVAAATSHGFTGWLVPYNDVAALPLNTFTRALPIEHVAVGVQAVLLGLWIGRRSAAASDPEPGS